MYVCSRYVCPQILRYYFFVKMNYGTPYMTIYGAHVERKLSGSGPEGDRKWTRSVGTRSDGKWSIPNTSHTSLTNLMRGIYMRRVLAPCDFFQKNINSQLLLLNIENYITNSINFMFYYIFVLQSLL